MSDRLHHLRSHLSEHVREVSPVHGAVAKAYRDITAPFLVYGCISSRLPWLFLPLLFFLFFLFFLLVSKDLQWSGWEARHGAEHGSSLTRAPASFCRGRELGLEEGKRQSQSGR